MPPLRRTAGHRGRSRSAIQIALWKARGRGSRIVARVRSGLRDVGLVTDPDFRQVALDVVVKLVHPPPETPANSTADDTPDFGLTVGTFPSAASGVEAVPPGASLAEAQTRMLVNDFSQLAVMSGERSLKGAVTWQSIAEALMRSHEATLADATMIVQPVRYSDDLLRLVPRGPARRAGPARSLSRRGPLDSAARRVTVATPA